MAKVIGHKEFVFLADCKAASMATRGQIAGRGGIYCFPLPMNGQNPLLLKQWVLNPPTHSEEIRLPRQDETEPAVGRGFEVELGKLWLNPETHQWVRWHERYLVVYSENFASSQLRGLEQRLNAAENALLKLAAKPGKDLVQLDEKFEAILKRHRVSEFFVVNTKAEIFTQTRHLGRGRPTAKSPQQQIVQLQLQLQFSRQSAAIEQAQQLLGWRLYVTNASTIKLSLSQAVIYYRDEWLLERGFHRFKRGNLPALPIYFQNQDRIVGLMFLLTIALRVFTLIEFVVREALQKSQRVLAGLYDGNPKRATARPSTEQLLKTFCNLTLYFLPDSTIFITPLSDLQRQILLLMKLPESLYQLHLLPCKT
jgi:transposase